MNIVKETKRTRSEYYVEWSITDGRMVYSGYFPSKNIPPHDHDDYFQTLGEAIGYAWEVSRLQINGKRIFDIMVKDRTGKQHGKTLRPRYSPSSNLKAAINEIRKIDTDMAEKIIDMLTEQHFSYYFPKE